MKLSSQSITNEQAIDPRYAFGKQDAQAHVTLSENRNPDFSWTDVPEGTKSFALICTDPDAPSKPDDINREDREIPATLPRINFYHWVLIDISASINTIGESDFSNGITPKGKSGPTAAHNSRQGLNDYTYLFASDNDMKGEYFGYDGPCPPFNDAKPHRYRFTLYALDIEKLPLNGVFNAQDALTAIKSHILAEDSITGLYTLNPNLTI